MSLAVLRFDARAMVGLRCGMTKMPGVFSVACNCADRMSVTISLCLAFD
jgi:hypothetical protein